MKIFDKISLPTADHKPIKLNLDSRHTTTSDFMQINVPYVRRMIPKEKLDININVFSRLAGMPVPTFGDATLNLRAFFVPYRTVFKGWLDFYEDTPHSFADGTTASIPYCPYVLNATLVQFFTLSVNSTLVPKDTSDLPTGPYDFFYKNEAGTVSNYYAFTPDGRYKYKILRQLGYQVIFDLQAAASSGYTKLNALDLLCYAKACLDYYFPAQYTYSSQFHSIQELFDYDAGGVKVLSSAELATLFSYCVLACYANDFLTAAFESPAGPQLGASSAYDLRDTSIETPSDGSYNSHATSQTLLTGAARVLNSTPVINGVSTGNVVNSSASYNLSQYALMALRKLSDFIKRHQLAGSRAVDRFLAQYGIKMDNDKSGRCYYLGSHHIPLRVQDVMSTSDTLSGQTGTQLGDYAGKGIIPETNVGFSCDAKEDMGLFLVLSTIVPNTAYYQGYDKQTLNATRLDFYMPEFDGLGTRAIEKGEVFTSLDTSSLLNGSSMRGVFGFTPQYAEYKIPKDRLTGDFLMDSISKSGFTSDGWHLFRKLNYTDYESCVHNLAFVRGGDWQQYLRMFYNTEPTADHFVLNYIFKVNSVAPVKPLFDSYEFEHEDGDRVTIEPNGNRVN